MKGVDFIPSSYHHQRRQRMWFRRRYMTVVLIAVTWSVGTLLTKQFISHAYGQMTSLQSAYENGLKKVELADRLEVRLADLIRKDRTLKRLCLRTPVSTILSELSVRVGDRVLLTDLKLLQTPVQLKTSEAGNASAGLVRIGAAANGKASALPEKPMCTSVVLTGIAADAGEVASLIARLEESEYFAQVLPAFSQNQTFQERSVTEFEIRCVVSDFVID